MKTVLLTGASSGIGEATARLLSQNNYNVMLVARREERLKALVNQLGKNTAYTVADVCQPQAVKQAVANTITTFGSLDVLINNAGLGHMAPLEEAPLEDWHHMVNVNVNGLLSCVHAALPHLIENKGNIINLASVAAHGVFPRAVVYCATKHAVAAISKGLRLELRGRVKITDISPGAVETEFLEQTHHKETKKAFKEGAFEGIVLEAKDIANTILHVLSQPEHVVLSEVIIRPNQ